MSALDCGHEAAPTYYAAGSAYGIGEHRKVMDGTEIMFPGYADRPDVVAWRKARENVTYTDGTRVREGDSIRYHQAPGGLMAHGDWRYGVAAYVPDGDRELCLLSGGRYYGLFSHVIERVES